MGQLLGGIVGIFLFSLLFNFIFKKIRKVDTKKQRATSVLVAVIFGSSVWTYNGLSSNQPISEIIIGVVVYIIGGGFTLPYMLAKGKSPKQNFSKNKILAVSPQNGFWLCPSCKESNKEIQDACSNCGQEVEKGL